MDLWSNPVWAFLCSYVAAFPARVLMVLSDFSVYMPWDITGRHQWNLLLVALPKVSFCSPIYPPLFSDQQLPFIRKAPSVRRGSSAVAVYNSRQARIPVDMMVNLENLVDAVVYTWESSTGKGQLNRLGPSHFVPCAEERWRIFWLQTCYEPSILKVSRFSVPGGSGWQKMKLQEPWAFYLNTLQIGK